MNLTAERPLAGRRVLVTRAVEQSRELIRLLEAAGAEVLHVPAIRFAPPPDWDSLDRVVDSPSDWDWIIFTSVNGVEFFERRAREKGRDSALTGCAKIAAVGEATRDALRARGIEPDIVPPHFRGIELLPLLPDNQEGVCTAVVRAREGREELVQTLRAKGGKVHIAVAYETRGLDSLPDDARHLIAGGSIDALSFTSPSTVENVLRHLSADELGQLKARSRFVSIGPTTTAALRALGVSEVVEATAATMSGLVDAVVDAMRDR
jgi:uroporphyrinogen III methyltransferase / synthase